MEEIGKRYCYFFTIYGKRIFLSDRVVSTKKLTLDTPVEEHFVCCTNILQEMVEYRTSDFRYQLIEYLRSPIPLLFVLQVRIEIETMASWNASTLAESLAVMLQQEQTTYRSCNYLHPQSSSSPVNLRVVDEEVRTKMVDWCYSFVDTCQFERKSVAMAMEMVDRFLSKSSKVSEAVLCDCMQFQLLTITALYVVVKINGETSLAIDFIVYIHQDLYTIKEIESMERTLLNELAWRISAPISGHMAHHILSLVVGAEQVSLDKTTWNFILDEMTFQAEKAVRDYYFVTQRPSTIAIAAMLNVIDLLSEKHDCRSLCCALDSVMNDDFDSIKVIQDTKSRLFSLVYSPEARARDGTESYRQVDEFQ